ncbi:MAG: hypothetical protein M1816_000993 [Peltula sp. TS41687]|nr:MAG: hypothetical protein M1816_000993 [Peltula sp. TS41687]
MRFSLRSTFLLTICCAASLALPLPQEEDPRVKTAKRFKDKSLDLTDPNTVIGITTAGVTTAAGLMGVSGPLYEKMRDREWNAEDRKRAQWADKCAKAQIFQSPWAMDWENLSWCWEEYDRRKAQTPSKDVPPLDPISDRELQKRLWSEDCAHKMFKMNPWQSLSEHRGACMIEWDKRSAERPMERVAPLSSDAELRKQFWSEVCAQERFQVNPSKTLETHRMDCQEEYDKWKAASPDEPVPSPISLPGPDAQTKNVKEGDEKGGGGTNNFKSDLRSAFTKAKSLPSSLYWLAEDVVKRVVTKTKGVGGMLNFQAFPGPPITVPRMMLVP